MSRKKNCGGGSFHPLIPSTGKGCSILCFTAKLICSRWQSFPHPAFQYPWFALVTGGSAKLIVAASAGFSFHACTLLLLFRTCLGNNPKKIWRTIKSEKEQNWWTLSPPMRWISTTGSRVETVYHNFRKSWPRQSAISEFKDQGVNGFLT